MYVVGVGVGVADVSGTVGMRVVVIAVVRSIVIV